MAKSSKRSVKEEEYITNKVLSVFTVCLLGVLVLMVMQRLLGYGSTFMLGMVVQKALLVAGILGAAWGVYLLILEHKGRRNAAHRIICGWHVLLVSVSFAVIMALVGHFGTLPIRALYVILPAIAVYYLVYHSYAAEFFLIAIDCGLALGLTWIVRRALVSANFGFMRYAAVAAMVCVALLQLLWTAQVRRNNGNFTFAGRKFSFPFSKHAYTMLSVTPVAMAVVVAAALVSALGIVCMGAAAGYLFITAVYYTVKLM